MLVHLTHLYRNIDENTAPLEEVAQMRPQTLKTKPISYMIRRLTHHQTAKQLCVLAIALGFLSACDDEETQENTPMIRGGETAGETAGGSSAGSSAGTTAGSSAGISAGSSAGESAGDSAGTTAGETPPRVRTIETCEQLCGTYEMCLAPDAHPWGECLEGCMGEDWDDQRFRSYVSCLKVEPCESIEACRIPPAPLPSCEEACATLELCEVDYQLPMALTQMGTCTSACADETWGRQISSCVQSNERRLCDDPRFFDECILEQRGGECNSICAIRAGCEEDLNLIECTVNCLTESPEADPLAEYNRQRDRRCLSEAAGCEAVAECLTPPDPPLSESVDEVCTLAEGCGLFAEGACPERAGEVLRGLSSEGVSCLIDTLSSSCESDLTDCFTQGVPASAGDCSQYCFIAATCDELPAGQSEFDCVEDCNTRAMSDLASDFATYRARFACVSTNSCADFEACIGGAAERDECAELCAARASCGSEEEATCLARCTTNYTTERSRVERDCGRLLTCASTDQCTVPPAPNCADYCAPLEACGVADESCLTVCDNAEFSDPEGHLARLGCANVSERCDFISECAEDPSAAHACLNYCAYTEGCGDEEPSTPSESCVLDCARGELALSQALEFAPARDCLGALDPLSLACGDVASCLAPVNTLCSDVCAEALTCGLPLIGDLAEDCEAACGAGEIPNETLVCSATRSARSEGCAGVADCFGFPIPEPTPECAQYCDALKACDPSLDLYTCHTECIANSDGDALRAVCTEVATCEVITLCQDQDAVSPTECLRACQDLDAQCQVTGDGARFTDLIACADRCGGVALAQGEGGGEAVSECINQAMCDAEALDACFSGDLSDPSLETCQRSWAVLELCGISATLDEATFYTDCAAEYAADPAATLAKVECLETNFDPTDIFCLGALATCGAF